MGYAKINKRCIPKEGMPHAHKACQKKKERKDSPCPKINKGERWIMQGSSLFIKKYSTHLHLLIRLYDLFLLGSCF